ncbi:hypothetical protein HANVADRAFT_51957 [Hanseniaspora valbyensis NRRL Y-1626]|uniref:FYVE-type domain-containing protein n=1 Tax=Hanseniaspora valbyensis NRRL Y-1626 TaxID=766949 RepID=A0A1B7TGI6_9ASCO|nr:hypothetical protein HANVADRAFT_51957 [Hanseniaspora valbyensis NRRL Y-1626]
MSYTSTTNTSIDTNNTSVETGIINIENIKNNTDNLISMFDVNNINVVKKDIQENDINEADQSIANELSKEIQDTDDEVEHEAKSLIPNHSSKKMYASSSSDDSDLIDNINLNNNTNKLQQNDQLNNIDTQSVTGKTDDTFKIMSPKDQLSFNNQYKNISNNSHLITSDIEEEEEQQQQQNSSNEDTASILTQEDTSGQQDNKQIPVFDDKISQNNLSSDSTVDQLQQQQEEEEEKRQVIQTPEQIFLEKKSNINDQLSQSFNKVKKNSINGKKTHKKSSSSGNSNEGPKIIFEKRKISTKPRTHSIQSVLSNVSSRNVLSRHSTHDDANNYNNQERAQSSQAVNGSTINGPIYDMLYNPSQQVQSPAMMTTLKKVRSSIQLNNAPSNLQTNHLASTLSNGHKRQHSLISTFSNNNNNNSSTNLAGLRGSYETDKVLIGERVPFISRDGDSKDLTTTTKNSDEENSNNNHNHNNNNNNNDLHLSKNTLHKTNNEKNQLNDDDVINNDLIEWKNGSVTSMVSGTLTTYRPNRFSNNTNNNFNGNKTVNRTSNGSDVIEDDASDTDAAIEKKLTTDALKKLNLLQQQKKNRRKASMISQISTASSIDSPTKLRSYNSFAKRDNDAINEEQRSSVGELMEGENDYEYEDTFGKDISSLSFFGKNIIMDSTIVPRKHSIVPQVNNNSSNTNEKIIFPKKQSIISPETPTTTHATKNKKKKQQQIEVPKKPLYTPAVLRDINETKISNDVLVKRALSPSMNHHTNSNNLQQQHSSSNSSSLLETDSVKTMATSTSTWSRLKNLFHQTPSNPDLPQTTTASFITPKQESITIKHWVPDDLRNACFDCAAKFNLFDRRHHCRHCGEIFCFRHLRRYLYLNSQAHFIIGATGLGRLAKVCDSCLDKYDELLLSGSGSLGVEEEENAQNTGNNAANGGIENNGGGLPEDWYWSSF